MPTVFHEKGFRFLFFVSDKYEPLHVHIEKENWRFIANGVGIHWEALDEDISIQALLNGQSSQESQTSFERWLKNRK